VLPGGFWDAAGTLHRDFDLTPLSGRDEELLLAPSPAGESASLVTAVLSRCVRRVGTISPVSSDVVRELLVADRQYLLLRLRQLTFGDQVRAHLFCPWPDCGQRVSVEFSIAAVPVTESADRARWYSLTLSPEATGRDDDSPSAVRFRLPNGADQEEVSPWLMVNEARALTLLLERCIESIGPVTSPSEDQVAALSPRARTEIEQSMESLAPRVEQTMEATCAECGRAFLAPFDVQRFFFGDLRADSDLLYREVHYLAYHYHWSESEVMAMSREKRRLYLDVLGSEIERLNRGG
jgi:hypothetical protein